MPRFGRKCRPFRPVRLGVALLAGLLALAAWPTAAQAPQDIYKDLPCKSADWKSWTGVLPRTVDFFGQDPQSPEAARPFFDDFSWRIFIALNWPANPGDRGQPRDPTDPEVFKQAYEADGKTPDPDTTWLSYRSVDDLFGQADPPKWASTEPLPSPCEPIPGKRVFSMLTKSGTVFGDVNQAFSYPLIDQKLNYAYYDVRFNQAQYDDILTRKLYLIQQLAAAETAAGKAGLQLPSSFTDPKVVPPKSDGSIMVKEAWRILADGVDSSRYYTVAAQVFVPESALPEGVLPNVEYGGVKGRCEEKTLGLVGLHLARKLKDFPEWTWSTFEQVDNVPADGVPPPAGGYSFNNGTDTPKTEGGWANRPSQKSPTLQPPADRTAVQVTRLNPIPTTPAGCSTIDLNGSYQKALAGIGSVWQYYQLVATQWPGNPTQFALKESGGIYPQDSGGAFPVDGVVNTSAETYVQSKSDAVGGGGNSCMACHYGAGLTDFSWVLKQRSHPPMENPPQRKALAGGG